MTRTGKAYKCAKVHSVFLTLPLISNNKQTKDYFRASALIGEIPSFGLEKRQPCLEKKTTAKPPELPSAGRDVQAGKS